MRRQGRGHGEGHVQERLGWLRAAVLGANDGIVSVGALVAGVAGAEGGDAVIVAGLAGLVGGALSMAAGEYVSVSSQRDAERADIAKETWELANEPDAELEELVMIWQSRGLDGALAAEVAQALTDHDALGSHLRDELGIDPGELARPFQAAWSSALAFAAGAALPVVVSLLVPPAWAAAAVTGSCLVALAILGWLSASWGGAPRGPAVGRVVAGGALALGLTWGLGAWWGVSV